jgi:hypothetical protein
MPAAYLALDWPFEASNPDYDGMTYAERMEVIAFRTRMWLSKLD